MPSYAANHHNHVPINDLVVIYIPCPMYPTADLLRSSMKLLGSLNHQYLSVIRWDVLWVTPYWIIGSDNIKKNTSYDNIYHQLLFMNILSGGWLLHNHNNDIHITHHSASSKHIITITTTIQTIITLWNSKFMSALLWVTPYLPLLFELFGKWHNTLGLRSMDEGKIYPNYYFCGAARGLHCGGLTIYNWFECATFHLDCIYHYILKLSSIQQSARVR